jgi:hypothetical protein
MIAGNPTHRMATSTLSKDLDTLLSRIEGAVGADSPLAQALPVPDIIFGGGLLVIVIMFHAFWIRFVTGSFLKRTQAMSGNVKLWRADVLFATTVVALLTLHLTEVVLWSTGFVLGQIVTDWGRATWFVFNCYTALGEPFHLSREWRLVPSMIAASGIFTFAWTASVLVNFVARYNELRASIIARKSPARVEFDDG